jgi:hypothetical protein
MTRDKFFSTLFEPGELTCYAHNIYETELYEFPIDEDVFFSINPMHTKRLDSNVTCYRNILLELDNMPLEQQIAYIQQKLPVTSIVYSGGKSYHFIISLADPCNTKEEYDNLVARIHAYIPEIDKATKNPSRFSRIPGATRPDTQKTQELIFLGTKVTKFELYNVLPEVKQSKPQSVQPEGFFSSLIVDAMFKPDSVMQKVGLSGRNQFFFWLGQRLKEGNANTEQKLKIIEQTYNNLKNKADFKLTEAKQAARIK